MKIAFMVGSFNPWHEGHEDVAKKTLKVFDRLVIIQMTNSDKILSAKEIIWNLLSEELMTFFPKRLHCCNRDGESITEAIGNFLLGETEKHEYAIIRGMRNEKDFCDEQILNYWYEDLGIKMPIFYVIADRNLVHISSSAIKAANKFVRK